MHLWCVSDKLDLLCARLEALTCISFYKEFSWVTTLSHAATISMIGSSLGSPLLSGGFIIQGSQTWRTSWTCMVSKVNGTILVSLRGSIQGEEMPWEDLRVTEISWRGNRRLSSNYKGSELWCWGDGEEILQQPQRRLMNWTLYVINNQIRYHDTHEVNISRYPQNTSIFVRTESDIVLSNSTRFSVFRWR